MIQEKVIKKEPTTFRSGSSQVVYGVNEMSQVQIPNSDHCIYELELIIFVSQGLTLSTASLVLARFNDKQEKRSKMIALC